MASRKTETVKTQAVSKAKIVIQTATHPSQTKIIPDSPTTAGVSFLVE